jgi:TPR repeat protein
MIISKQTILLLALMAFPFAGYAQLKKDKTKTPQSVPVLPAGESEEKKAFRETLKKAEMGDPKAQSEIGGIYAGGNTNLGIKADRKIGKAWYLKAANQGYQPVYSKLSMFHAMGANFYQSYGLNQSEEIAELVKWFLLSRNTESYPSLEWLGGKMSESTKAEGERRAKTFRAEQAKNPQAPSGK